MSPNEPIGNPIALLLERAVYAAIGLFFIAALIRSFLRKKENTEQK